jgi:hypothetical protein
MIVRWYSRMINPAMIYSIAVYSHIEISPPSDQLANAIVVPSYTNNDEKAKGARLTRRQA